MEDSLLVDLTRKATRGWATTKAIPCLNLPIVSKMAKYVDIKMVEIQSYLEPRATFLRREAST